MEKIKRFFATDKMQEVFESREFIWIWAAVVLIFWVTNGWIAGFIIASLTACVILCLCRDTLPVLTVLWTFLFMMGVNRHSLNGSAAVIAAIIPLIIGIIVNIVRFKPSFRFLSYKSVKVTTVGILAFCVAVALSGIAMKDRNLGVAFIVVALCVLLALGYLFFSATISGGEDGKRVIKYLLCVMFVSGVLITLQVIIRYIQLGGLQAVRDTFAQKSMDIGWGGPNNYSIILAMMIPSTIYYGVKNGKYNPLFILLSAVQFALVVLSRSRGSVLFGSLVLVIALGYAVVKSEYRGRMVLTIVAVMDVSLLLLMYYGKEVAEMFKIMFEIGLDDNGRQPLYQAAVELFKWQPIFGVGFDYNLGGMAGDGYTPFWYHSTFYQALASTGIAGFLSWIFLEYARVRVFLINKSAEKTYMLFAFSIFWLYALTDVFYFTPNGLIFLFVITLAIEKTLIGSQGRPYSFCMIEQGRNKKLLTKDNRDE